MSIRAVIRAAAVAMALGCAGQPRVAGQEQAPVERPLSAFASRPVLVLPTRFLGPDGSLGWAVQAGDPATYLGDVDAEIAFALEQRGLGKRWIFPPAIMRSVRRNPGYAADPHELSAEWMRPPMKKPPEQFPEPFGSEVRALVAFQEGAQYVLYPVEVHFEPVAAAGAVSTGGGGANGSAGPATAPQVEGRAVLRVVLLDARRSRIVWMANVISDPYPSFSPALAASVAEHLADLIAKR